MKKKQLIDGFIPRRTTSNLGGLHTTIDQKKASVNMPQNKLLHTTGSNQTRKLGEITGKDLTRPDIEESLDIIDSENNSESNKKLSRRQQKLLDKQIKRPKSLLRRIIKGFVILIILVLLAVGGYTAYKFIGAGTNIFQGNIFDIFTSQPLQKDVNGRSNFLVLGTSEDDPGHEGAYLTDSILVVSIDSEKKDVYMFSVPRDLYVRYGRACPEGYSGKINSYFSCVSEGTESADEQERLSGTQKLIGDIFGLDIQYGVHINQKVIREAVDAVGGIDVDVQGSNGDPGVLDRNADWRCNYTCYYVKYDNGVHHLDGEHALYLSMARGHDAPTYGLGNSNFDREKNQQKILIALKDKATSTGALTNLSAITKLLEALGNNLRTNIQTGEIRTLVDIANDIKPENIHTLSFIGDNYYMKTGSQNGASVVMPSLGVFEYDDIQKYIKDNINSTPVSREAAPIMVLNGTEISGIGKTEAEKLTDQGFNVESIDNAPETITNNAEIYQIGDDNQATADKLASIYNVTIKKTMPPLPVNGNIRFVIIIGSTTS